MSRSSSGLNGGQYDRYLAHNEQSTIHKMKERYWTTKQTVIRKLGKKEDEHIVASDAQLDAKLEVFQAIQTSSMDLLKAIEKYQDSLCSLSQEENTMGRYLKNECSHDKTRAGKMMAAVGKAQTFSSQQRLALRVPLVRLYQEVETFRYRAISDTLMTINRMESARTEYRGALLWMKDISEVLDPDTYKQLEKFRKVQAQVKKTKAKFDKLKLDTMQKIDLLAASRCNMYSHVLANYQTTLLHFWEKTSRTMTAVAESFKGYQYYEFNMLKELAEPSKRLAKNTAGREEAERDIDDPLDRDGFLQTSGSGEPLPTVPPIPLAPASLAPSNEDPELALREAQQFWDTPTSQDNQNVSAPSHISSNQSGSSNNKKVSKKHHVSETLAAKQSNESSNPGVESGDSLDDGKCNRCKSSEEEQNPDLLDMLINFDEADRAHDKSKDGDDGDKGSMNNLLEAIDREFPATAGRMKRPEDNTPMPFIDFGEDVEQDRDLEEIKRRQEEEFDFSGKLVKTTENKQKKKLQKDGPQDLLCDELEQDDADKDDMALLNEILNAPSTTGEDEFTREWQAVFGQTPLSSGTNFTPVEPDQANTQDFLPSSLLDLSRQMSPAKQGQLSSSMSTGGAPGNRQPSGGRQPTPKAAQSQQQPPPSKGKKGQKTDMSAWFNLFADLDPLSNPDAIGRSAEDMTDA